MFSVLELARHGGHGEHLLGCGHAALCEIVSWRSGVISPPTPKSYTFQPRPSRLSELHFAWHNTLWVSFRNERQIRFTQRLNY